MAEAIRTFRIPNLVVDPVMVAKSGDPLLAEDARKAIRDELLPLATVITPNMFEAEALLGRRIEDLDAMRDAARELMKFGCRWVVIKGGSLDIESRAVDVVCDGGEPILLTSPRFESRNTQGTGCTFASAIAAGLAKGLSPPEAIKRAKEYVTEAIRSGPPIGSGHGPRQPPDGRAQQMVRRRNSSDQVTRSQVSMLFATPGRDRPAVPPGLRFPRRAGPGRG